MEIKKTLEYEKRIVLDCIGANLHMMKRLIERIGDIDKYYLSELSKDELSADEEESLITVAIVAHSIANDINIYVELRKKNGK